jgi:hypothetical protein
MIRTLTLLSCLFIIACHSGKRIGTSSDELYTAPQEWPVKINDGWFSAKTFAYGPYSTSSRKNGVTDAMAVSFIKDPQQPYNFTVNGNQENMLVQIMNTQRAAFENRSLPPYLAGEKVNAPIFYALINGTKNNPLKRWELILKNPTYLELNDNKSTGILRSPDTDIRITAHNRFGKTNSYEKICYEFQYRGQPVAAVIPGNKPQLWVSKNINPETEKVLAAAIGALLFR